MDELAQSAMDAVTDGRVKIIPERYAKGYLDWLSEKRDWPIGRQLWWGHRIPVWSVTVADDDAQTFDRPGDEYRACHDEILLALEHDEDRELTSQVMRWQF